MSEKFRTHPEAGTLQDIRAAHGTLSAYQVYLAVQAAQRLRWAIRLAAAAMTLLIAGVIATWLAPGPVAALTYIEVTHGNYVTCGIPQSAPAGQMRISVPGESEPVVIPIEQITAVALATACR